MAEEGKQLLTEAIYLYGVMLFILDQRIDGMARERMLIAFYRCVAASCASASASSVCDVGGWGEARVTAGTEGRPMS